MGMKSLGKDGSFLLDYFDYVQYEAIIETYKMSNICPQKAGLNSGRWTELEQTIGQDRRSHASLAGKCKEVWVVTGPIYDADIQKLKSGVEIPDAFFKIVLDVDEETKGVRVISFVMPNEKCKGELEDYLVWPWTRSRRRRGCTSTGSWRMGWRTRSRRKGRARCGTSGRLSGYNPVFFRLSAWVDDDGGGGDVLPDVFTHENMAPLWLPSMKKSAFSEVYFHSEIRKFRFFVFRQRASRDSARIWAERFAHIVRRFTFPQLLEKKMRRQEPPTLMMMGLE
jgi:hypothetical protein